MPAPNAGTRASGVLARWLLEHGYDVLRVAENRRHWSPGTRHTPFPKNRSQPAASPVLDTV